MGEMSALHTANPVKGLNVSWPYTLNVYDVTLHIAARDSQQLAFSSIPFRRGHGGHQLEYNKKTIGLVAAIPTTFRTFTMHPFQTCSTRSFNENLGSRSTSVAVIIDNIFISCFTPESNKCFQIIRIIHFVSIFNC